MGDSGKRTRKDRGGLGDALHISMVREIGFTLTERLERGIYPLIHLAYVVDLFSFFELISTREDDD